jgi:hypothetical protein
MPFADITTLIPRVSESGRPSASPQLHLFFVVDQLVRQHVQSGEYGRPGRGASRRIGYGIGKPGTLAGQAVEIGRMHILDTSTPHGRTAHLIGQYKEYIGFIHYSGSSKECVQCHISLPLSIIKVSFRRTINLNSTANYEHYLANEIGYFRTGYDVHRTRRGARRCCGQSAKSMRGSSLAICGQSSGWSASKV